MSHFLNNTFGQAVGHIHHLSNAAAAVEIRCGKYSLLLKHRIAEGGFGFVDLVSDIHTETDYVLKRCNIDRAESMATVKKEINILQRFKSPYIVELLDSDIHTLKSNQREALLLLSYCPGGHLLDRLNSRNGKLLPPESIYRIFAQITKAVALLHQNNPPVTHRDLKLENVLFGTVRMFLQEIYVNTNCLFVQWNYLLGRDR
jgi:serine/threonine protein kinase